MKTPTHFFSKHHILWVKQKNGGGKEEIGKLERERERIPPVFCFLRNSFVFIYLFFTRVGYRCTGFFFFFFWPLYLWVCVCVCVFFLFVPFASFFLLLYRSLY